MRFTLLVAVLGLFALGCRSDDPKMMGGDDDPNPDAPPGTMDVSIKDIQMGMIAEGTPVKVEGVVVTAVDTYGSRTGDVFVQEPEGGEYSGLKVFGVPLDQVATLQVGDVVTITNARVTEYRYEPMEGTPWPEGQSLTELEPIDGAAMQVTKTGTMTPVATDVDVLAIEMLATREERDAEWEKWEGVLINARKARQTTEVTSFGMGDDQKSFRTTGFMEVQSALTALGTPVIDTCYAGIVGVVDYFFSYKLMPRTEADMTAGGTDCAEVVAQEATIVEIQTGAVAGEVILNNVVVTAVDNIGNNKGFWVADAAQAAANNGIFVYTRNATPPYAVGAIVNVRGDVDEFDLGSMGMPATGDTITQIENAIHMAATGTAVPMPLTVDIAAAGDIGVPGEQYEGVLIRAENLKVTNINVTNTMTEGQVRVELTDGMGNKIQMAKEAFNFPAQTLDACLTVTGIGSVAIFDDKRTINPRSAADIMTSTGCN